MAKEPELSAGKLIEHLYGLFSPILTKWADWAPADLYLWKDTKGKNASTILQNDMR